MSPDTPSSSGQRGRSTLGSAQAAAEPPLRSRFLEALGDHPDRPAGTATVAQPSPPLTPAQHRLFAGVAAQLGLPAGDAAALVGRQRDFLRSAALRRGEDVEVLAGLVRLLVGRPLASADEAADIQLAHHHLRLCHWWPSGPEDVPLAALLMAGPGAAGSHADRLERLHLMLSEGDEVPGDPGAVVALYAAVAGLDETQVLLRFCILRTELLLSSIALQDEDIAALPALVAAGGDVEALMSDYLAERSRRLAGDPAAGSITAAADSVVLRHLSGYPRRAYLSVLLIHDWMAQRVAPRRRPVWYAGIRA